MQRIIHFSFTLISLSDFKHNGKQNHFTGFHVALYIILKMNFLIFRQTGEKFFLNQDPNYARPHISMFNAEQYFNKNKREAVENKRQLGNKIISSHSVHIIVVHTNGKDYKSHPKQPNPRKTPDMTAFYYVWRPKASDLSGILRSL